MWALVCSSWNADLDKQNNKIARRYGLRDGQTTPTVIRFLDDPGPVKKQPPAGELHNLQRCHLDSSTDRGVYNAITPGA